jgi:hypothetical protein
MKTSEMIGAALDWAVAKCEKYPMGIWYDEDQLPMIRDDEVPEWKPSTDWAQGGPIIEREAITTRPLAKTRWEADTFDRDGNEFLFDGPTPLIAAMRCYVASKLGNDVEIPEALQ